MVGDVGGEVGRLAVGADQDPVLVVAELGRPQPHRALALVDVPAAAQLVERVLDPARLAQRALRRPGVEADAEALQGRLDPGPHRLGPEALEPLEVVGAGAVGGELGGELGDVLALVAVLRRLGAPHPGGDRLGEQPHLAAGVVEVVLALDLVAAAGSSSARDRVAEGGAAAAGGGHRPGRVGAHELDQDALGRARPRWRPSRSPAASSSATASRCQRSERKTLRNPGPGDLDPLGARAEDPVELGRAGARRPRAAARPRPARAASRRWSSSRRARASAVARGSASTAGVGVDRRGRPDARRRAARRSDRMRASCSRARY